MKDVSADRIHDPDAILAKLLSRDFWHELAPGLTIEAAATPPPLPRSFRRDLRRRRHLQEEGFVHVGDLRLEAPFAEMAAVMGELRDRGLPPAFVGVYDAPWQICARMRGLMTNLMATEVALVPDFWGWVVRPGEAGFSPHRDRLGSVEEDGTPVTLTLWLPVTPARPDNGCIHAIPASTDRYYIPGRAQSFVPQNLRALPAEPGEALVWTGHVAHWGGRASPHTPKPRLSIAWEFQRADRDPVEGHVLACWPEMPFEVRLGLIGRQMRWYAARYPDKVDWAPLADALVARFPLKGR